MRDVHPSLAQGGQFFTCCRKSQAKSSVSDTLLGGHQGVASSLSTALNYAKDKGLFNEVTKGRTSDRYGQPPLTTIPLLCIKSLSLAQVRRVEERGRDHWRRLGRHDIPEVSHVTCPRNRLFIKPFTAHHVTWREKGTTSSGAR